MVMAFQMGTTMNEKEPDEILVLAVEFLCLLARFILGDVYFALSL